ncbi:HNH endonuclease signature motif containing protein [Lentzea flava]|uniref:HNH endonuclease n=1 Tax=Lentzea flava TaxID=103732 RepID=A0ABQ2VGT1_9PSEU|nr:HNH endonuclease signature motif containing protein [Lentzea flava]MCP2205402.1 HNH endonuclease [Lentzea flava]GGU86252.1 HNH endonuclease [Lentzea flava]
MSDPRLPLLSTGELLRSIVGKVTEIRAREYAVMQEIAELNRRGAAAELGYKTLPQVLRHALRWDPTTARRWVEQAVLLSSEITPTGNELAPALPATAAAAAEGALSLDHVVAVAEAMKTLPAEAETLLVDRARDFEPAEVRSFGADLAYRLYQNDPEPRDPEPEPAGNRLTLRQSKTGDWKLAATMDAVTGAKFATLLDPLAKPRPTTAEGPDPRSRDERQGDALAELIDLTLRADTLPEHGGEPVALTLTMAYEALAEQTGHAVLDNGERIPADQVRQLACAAGVIPMVMGSRSQPLDVGRRSRLFTAGIRRALVARDHGCAFPGCGRPPKHCDAHHIQHWADGGDTRIDNGVLLCRHHHTLIHRSEWAVKMEQGVPVFYPPAWLDPLRKPRRNLLHTAA